MLRGTRSGWLAVPAAAATAAGQLDSLGGELRQSRRIDSARDVGERRQTGQAGCKSQECCRHCNHARTVEMENALDSRFNSAC